MKQAIQSSKDFIRVQRELLFLLLMFIALLRQIVVWGATWLFVLRTVLVFLFLSFRLLLFGEGSRVFWMRVSAGVLLIFLMT